MSYRSLPTVPKVARTMDEVPDWALRCHAWLHPWRDPVCRRFSYYGFDSILAVYRCTSCHTLRRDVREYRNPGVLTTRLYRYPDLHRSGFGATIADYREEWFRRFEAPPDDTLSVETWHSYLAAA